MANDDSEKWFLPDALDINKNPAVRLQSAQMRTELEKRAVSPFARLSPEEFARIRARGRIEHLSQALQQVHVELQTHLDPHLRIQLKEARNALAIRLAENLAILERYDLATEIDPRPEYREQYAKHLREQLRVSL